MQYDVMGQRDSDASGFENDIQWEEAGVRKNDLSPSLYKMLYMCVRELFFQPDSDAAIDMALGYMGQGIGVSRAYVFLKESDGSYSNTQEWCAPGVEPEKDSLQRMPLDEMQSKWIETLKNDGLLVASDIKTLNRGVYEELARQGIKSVVAFPVWKDKELYGFVGFDDCEKIRGWTQEELQALHTLTRIITSILAKTWLQDEIKIQSAMREIVLNSMNTAIHVTDLDTKEILFANSGLQRLYNNQSLTGRKCYEALENRLEECDMCPANRLRKNPGEVYQWEHYCEAVGRHLRVSGRVIPWIEGKLAHLEYADDVTELRDYQNQLKLLASTDMLTQTMNRHTFFGAARPLLETSAVDGAPATLVFIDIDGLKKTNDTYGHSKGDELILNVVNALKGNFRENDIIGRFGGDEFIVLLPNCTEGNARKRIIESQKKLADMSLKKGRGYSFSFGLAQNSEVAGKAPEERIDELIKIADKRMFDQKKRKKQREYQ